MREALWSKNFILLMGSNLLLFMALEMLLPTLPVFAAEQGGSQTQIGLIMGLFTFTAVISRLGTGYGIKRLGQKKLLLLGVAISLIALTGYYLAATLAVLLVLRVVHGVGFGIATTLFGTAASDLVPASRRGEGMGFFATGNSISFALGPFFGIWIMTEYGFKALFLIGAVVMLLSLISTCFVRFPRVEKKAPAAAAPVAETGSWMDSVVERKAFMPSLLGLLIGIPFGTVLSFIALFGKEQGLGSVGIFFLVVAISEFLIRFISGPLFDRKGRMWVLLPAAILCIIASVMLYFTHSTAMLLLSGLFYGFGFGALFPALQAWVIDLVEPERRGVATATYYNAFDVGIGSGSILLGAVAAVTNYSTMYLLSGGFFILYIVLYVGFERRLRRKASSKSMQA
ncbi:MFS transporter [Paenibacillus sp. Leaf72]|uniref:MFS transporter n=1 Tax=Paenibacillus sp. Leaf72 TaxID=1736234 RepID=UPI0006FA4D2B|nr:MFS transporter [Paenibacillus sp. Leaf72]KQO18510.1 hypothetical protein ASF12_07875 [Paenibacillus sp. Leaf72]